MTSILSKVVALNVSIGMMWVPWFFYRKNKILIMYSLGDDLEKRSTKVPRPGVKPSIVMLT
jgi:hypothetical protein